MHGTTAEPQSLSLHPVEAQPDQSHLNATASQECLVITDLYCSGSISKAAAILQIQLHLNTEDSHFEESLESYIRILENFEQFHNDASVWGQLTARPEIPSNDEHDVENEREASIETQLVKQNKRHKSLSPDAEDNIEQLKQKVNFKALPWIPQDELDLPMLSPMLKRTQELLENYSWDPKFIKSLLLNNSRCPQFPDSEWSNLIASRAIDLDHILTGQYTISHDKRWTEKFSDLKFIIRSNKPAKTINKPRKWVTAWDVTIQTMLLIFPHRASEFIDYSIHIKSLFRALPTYVHDWVINYDCAVCIHASQ